MGVVAGGAPHSLLAAGICALAACSDSTGPDLTQSPYLFSTVAVGHDHTCGIRGDSTLLCWGRGYSGQLGDGESWGPWSATESRATPVPVKSTRRFTEVSAGGSHTCALASDGTAYCWGSGFYGQLGIDSQRTAVPTAVRGGHRFLTISAGYNHTCAVAMDGAGYCWGFNQDGALGDGTTENRASPTLVAGGLRFLALSAAFQHTCGVADNGATYCWGANRWGQLGDLTDSTRTVPTRVAGTAEFVTVSAGGSSSCGVTGDHRLYCWGHSALLGADTADICRPSLPYNDSPQRCAKAPVAIATGVEGGVAAVAVGGGYACTVSPGGATYCWGANGYGQLGNGTREAAALPTPLASSIRFAVVSASAYTHTCGVSTGGVLYCWGSNYYGQLGDDSGALSWPVPVVVWGW